MGTARSREADSRDRAHASDPVRIVPRNSQRLRPSGRLRFNPGSRRGPAGLASSLAARAVTTIYRRSFVLAYALTGESIPPFRATLDVEFAVLESGDAERYRRFRPEIPDGELRRRFARGDRCYAALWRGELVDACWCAAGRVPVPYLGRSLVLAPGDVYHYDAFTLPWVRGHGVYMARNAFASVQHRSEGFTRSLALVAAENDQVWSILTRSGLRTIGRYDRLRLGPRSWYRSLAAEGESLPRLA